MRDLGYISRTRWLRQLTGSGVANYKYRYSGASAVPDSWGIESGRTTMDTVNYKEYPMLYVHYEATVT